MTLALIIAAVCLALCVLALALIHGAAIIADVMDEESERAAGHDIDSPPGESW